MNGKEIRLSKLFPEGKNSVVVAMDHGQTFGPMEGLEKYTVAAERLKEADAVLLTSQMVRFTGNLFIGKGSPTFITRLNWNTIHCEPWEYTQAYTTKAISVATGVAAGAEVVMASLVLQTGDEAHEAQNVSVFSALAEEATHMGVPMMGEVFPVGGLRAPPRRVPRLHPQDVPHHLRARRGRHQNLLHRRALRRGGRRLTHPHLCPGG